MTAYPHLFSPLQIGNVTVRNRIKSAAEQLGMGPIAIRRRGERIVAYQSDGTNSSSGEK